MPGPKNPSDALVWIKRAMEAGRYIPSFHFVVERADLRGIDISDVHAAIRDATGIEPYDGDARNGGTCWRVLGPDGDGERKIAVGVEAFLNRKRHQVVIVTVMEIR